LERWTLSTNEIQPIDLARSIVSTLEDKKGEDILLMDITNVASFADYFIFANGTSDRMLDSLGDALLEAVKKDFGINASKEGEPVDGWIVVDLGDVVVHLFSPEQRDYYDLEKLWDRGKVLVRLV
jgi:ribosome-associated protein